MLRFAALGSCVIAAVVLLCCTGGDPDLETPDIVDASAPDVTSSGDGGANDGLAPTDAAPDAEGKLLWTTQLAPGILAAHALRSTRAETSSRSSPSPERTSRSARRR